MMTQRKTTDEHGVGTSRPHTRVWTFSGHANGVKFISPQGNALGKVQKENRISARGAIHERSGAKLRIAPDRYQ
jgi:hypothetical protein